MRLPRRRPRRAPEGEQAKDGDEGVASAVATAGIWDGAEGLDEGDGGQASLLADGIGRPPIYSLARIRPRPNKE